MFIRNDAERNIKSLDRAVNRGYLADQEYQVSLNTFVSNATSFNQLEPLDLLPLKSASKLMNETILAIQKSLGASRALESNRFGQQRVLVIELAYRGGRRRGEAVGRAERARV